MIGRIKTIGRKLYNSIKSVYVVTAHHVTNQIPLVDSCIVSEEAFDAYLNGKDVIELSEIKKHKRNNSYIITFDDALDDLFTTVYPKMKKLNMPFTAFISVSLIGKKGYVTREQLVTMANDPLVTIGSHGLTHSRLTDCDDEQSKKEICESKQELESIIGKKVNYFSYPFGAASAREIKNVKKAGYRYAFGVQPRKLNCISLLWGRYRLPRYNLSNENPNPV